jgi:hypothetical protein
MPLGVRLRSCVIATAATALVASLAQRAGAAGGQRGRERVVVDATGFERRRQTNAFGRFITADEIRRRGSSEVGGVFNAMPGITNGGKLMRAPWIGGKCMPVLFVDGMQRDLDFMDELRPRNVRGIEAYLNPGAAPFMYRDPKLKCGSIIIWTRPAP